MIWRNLVVGAAVGLALVGCGDPLADRLEGSGRQPYSDDDPSILDGSTSTLTTTTAASAPGAPTTAAPSAPATAAPPAGVTREAFVAAGNAWCHERNVEGAAAILAGARTPQAALDALRLMTDHFYETAAYLEGQPAPPGDEPAIADLAGGLRHIASKIEPVLADGGFRTEQDRADLMTTFRTDGDVVTARFDAYGLTECF